MYPFLLALHNLWRWVALLALLTALAGAAYGWRQRLSFALFARRASLLGLAALDFQLLLGLSLYALSPLVRVAWANKAEAMRQHELRFFMVEHLGTMLFAVAAAHVGWWRSQRASVDNSRYRNVLGWYGAALVLILAGIPWWRPLWRAFGPA